MALKSDRDKKFGNSSIEPVYRGDSPNSLRDAHSGNMLLVPNLPPKRTSNLEAIMEIDEAADRPALKINEYSKI